MGNIKVTIKAKGLEESITRIVKKIQKNKSWENTEIYLFAESYTPYLLG